MLQFETEHHTFQIVDTPGHVDYVKNMITGAAQVSVHLVGVRVHLAGRQ